MILQTPWIERKFVFNFPLGLFPVIIERLRGTVPRIENLVSNKPDDQLSRKPGDSWSVKEQIGHLHDLEHLWLGRIEDFLAGEKILRAADMSNTQTDAAHHNNKSIEELLKQFTVERNKLVAKVEHMDEITAGLTAIHPRLQTQMRLIDSLFFVAEHDDHHMAKIRELLNT